MKCKWWEIILSSQDPLQSQLTSQVQSPPTTSLSAIRTCFFLSVCPILSWIPASVFSSGVRTDGLIKMAHNCSGVRSLARSKLIRRWDLKINVAQRRGAAAPCCHVSMAQWSPKSGALTLALQWKCVFGCISCIFFLVARWFRRIADKQHRTH